MASSARQSANTEDASSMGALMAAEVALAVRLVVFLLFLRLTLI